ncbi:MAG: hypothetical protein CMC65_07320 [Flavobacteriaceae bacterium]|nr:hypothetical protein [Flavobacteriaceae bacterium]|tara:strand:- start:48 stop:410 length:363 start_codon:yes stop_codon:yes gene_type:complete
MVFADLTWSPDQLDPKDGVTKLGWQSQYMVDNGYLIVIDTNTEGIETPLASATEPDQLYRCSVWSWNRDETTVEADAYLIEADCLNTRIQAIMTEVEALEGEVFPETTTTTTTAAAGQWD